MSNNSKARHNLAPAQLYSKDVEYRENRLNAQSCASSTWCHSESPQTVLIFMVQYFRTRNGIVSEFSTGVSNDRYIFFPWHNSDTGRSTSAPLLTDLPF